jgi:hypothetical protein
MKVFLHRVFVGLAGAASVFGAATSAVGQEIKLAGPISGQSRVVETRSRFADGFVLPSGMLEVGSELVFITSDRFLGGRDLDFTDLAIARLRFRKRMAAWVEAFVNFGAIAKQPKYTNESVFQGGFLGLRIPFEKHFAAELQAGAGPLLGNSGIYWEADQTIIAKPAIDKHTRFQLRAGAASTYLSYASPVQSALWMEQIVLGAEIDLGDREGGGWLGFDYRVPVSSGPSVATTLGARVFDPAVELSFQIGGVLSDRSDWDLFAAFSIIDRGDLAEPRTTLPILDGGFDQKQILFGVQHRFGRAKRD